jgi:hypothetical protein
MDFLTNNSMNFSNFVNIRVFGDDPTTAEKDGFFDGEMILFKNLTGFQNLEGLNPAFDPQLPQSNGLFTENGLSAITGFEAVTGIGNEGFVATINIYPNPSNGVINITGLETGAKVSVSDIHGQLVLIESSTSGLVRTIDLTRFNPGDYFIKIEQNGETIFRKVVMR